MTVPVKMADMTTTSGTGLRAGGHLHPGRTAGFPDGERVTRPAVGLRTDAALQKDSYLVQVQRRKRRFGLCDQTEVDSFLFGRLQRVIDLLLYSCHITGGY